MSTFARLFAFVFSAAAAFGADPALSKDWSHIRIGSEGGHPPFNSVDAMGQLKGFEIDLARAVCERLKASCDFVVQDFTGLLPALVAGRYDAVFSSLTITEDRKRFVQFSDRYYSTRAMIVTNRSNPVASARPEDLAGKTVGAKLGSTNARILRDAYAPAGVAIKLYVTHDEARLDLARGRLDALIGDKTALLDWLEKSPIASCCQVAGEDVPLPASIGSGVGAAIRKEDGDLKSLIDGALRELRADGGYERIRRRYFSFDPS